MVDISKAVTVSITAKCSDMCQVMLKNKDGKVIASHDGYVPNFMPGEHFGDYIEIDIDLATGRILNWKKPDDEVMAQPTHSSEWQS